MRWVSSNQKLLKYSNPAIVFKLYECSFYVYTHEMVVELSKLLRSLKSHSWLPIGNWNNIIDLAFLKVCRALDHRYVKVLIYQ